VCHLQEQQVGELFGVLDDTNAIVTEHVAVRPEFVDQAPGIRHSGLPFWSAMHDEVRRALIDRVSGQQIKPLGDGAGSYPAIAGVLSGL